MQEQIKGLITSLMLNTPTPVRSQLSEALTIIGQHDFPAKWLSLLPELLERLTGDLVTVEGILETANSIFKRYRYQTMTSYYVNFSRILISRHKHDGNLSTAQYDFSMIESIWIILAI